MKKIFCILTILVSMCASPAWCNTINLCRTHIPTFFEKHCDDEGYKIGTGLSAAPSYGQVDINTQSQTISIGCYKYKTSFDKLKKDIEKKCEIESNQIIELSGLSRPSNHVKKTGTPTSAPATTTVNQQKAGSPLNTQVSALPLYGFVIDDQGNPISGITVKIEGTTDCNDTTGPNGKWELRSSKQMITTNDTIVFNGSYYQKKEIQVSNYENESTIQLQLTAKSVLPLSGIVTDNQGRPISGVTVMIQGTSDCNDTTDSNGKWKLESCRQKITTNSTIVFNGPNYQGKDIKLSDYKNNSTIKLTAKGGSAGTKSTSIFPIYGYVKDTKNNPIEFANIGIPGASNGAGDCGTTSDESGYWKIDSCKNLPDTPQLQMSFIGYTTKTIPLSNYTNKTTTVLSEDQVYLEEAIIEECPTTSEEHPGATDLNRADDGKCYPSECDETRYDLMGRTGTSTARCQEKPCNFENGIGTWAGQANDYKCLVSECDKGYEPNSDRSACIKLLKECDEEQIKEHPNAIKTGIKENTIPGECIALECKCGYDLVDNKCVEWPENKECTADTKPNLPKHATGALMKCNDKGKAFCQVTGCAENYTENDEKTKCETLKGDCTHSDPNAKKAKYKEVNDKRICVITKCNDGFMPSEDGQKCEVSEGPCNADQLAETEHATAGELKKGQCIPTECEPGYVLSKKKCVAEEPKLSEEDSKKKIEELEKNAQAMKDKEQSTENKMLGAASMAATGIGAMQAASAYSEQAADEDAEQAMRAYLATFHCNYGGGINVKGGEKDVQLPGGNELVGLYSEYVNLANNLKVRKAALDMRPGIESESILDSATSGLYDDVAIGKTSGAFTSLARALMDPNGPDAIAWAKQKADSESQFKSGLTMAGIGAIGGAVGNMIINKNAPKESSDGINAKYDKLKTKLEQDIAAIPPQTAPCPSGTSGSKHPDCTCNDTSKIFNPDTNACDSCSGGKTAQNGECDCPSDKPLWDNEQEQCIAFPTSCTPQCTPTEGDHLIVLQNCSCTCSDGYDYQDGKCTCTGDSKTEQNGKCITAETKTETITEVIQIKTTTTVDNAVLPAGSLFKIGSAELLTQAQTALSDFVNGLSTSGYSNCKLSITGHTDPVGTTALNKTLSTQRAESVKTYIEGLNNSAIISVTADGHGEDNCTCGTRNKVDTSSINYADREYSACKDKADDYKLTGNTRFAPCRRVEISADCQKTTTITETTTE